MLHIFERFRYWSTQLTYGRDADVPMYRQSSSSTPGERAEWDRSVVLSVARTIEPDAERVMCWFTGDPINELGGRTARELVDEGVTAPLLDMLIAIRSGRRET
ncbi:hypothetical protein [Dyella sp. A6]|uniref:hypothetical protein n=1 Tax=Dyella aluminiiresistens TaxID=3069105 RepID=UPI002E75A42E|nr:hypothetical protein [Dyella sp. A6]